MERIVVIPSKCEFLAPPIRQQIQPITILGCLVQLRQTASEQGKISQTQRKKNKCKTFTQSNEEHNMAAITTIDGDEISIHNSGQFQNRFFGHYHSFILDRIVLIPISYRRP